MMFVFTTAEESGLLGAEYFAQHPPMPMDQVAANINVDGINYLGPDARHRAARRGSLDRSARWPKRWPRNANRTIGPDQHPERGYFFRSDHFPLAKAGVPALSISEPREFTGPDAEELKKKQEAYNTTDYHQPSDEFDPSVGFCRGGRGHEVPRPAGLADRRAAADADATTTGDQFANARQEVQVVADSGGRT